MDQALEVGFTGELLIVVGKGNQKGGKIFRPQPCQLEGTLGDLDATAKQPQAACSPNPAEKDNQRASPPRVFTLPLIPFTSRSWSL